jgi:hypothetical protein
LPEKSQIPRNYPIREEVFMKTANAYFKKLGFLHAAGLFCLAFAAVAGAQVAGNTQYCEITLKGCPYEYDNAELVVPLEVIALSTRVQACTIQDSSTAIGDPPAVMFIIDHSTSMDNVNGGNNDANGNRFRVTKALIDSIYAVYPNAEVGIVVFANGLVFTGNRDANLEVFQGIKNPKAPGGINQAYMPLLQLDQPAKIGGDNAFSTLQSPKVIDVYRSMFTVPATVTQKSTITGGPITQSGTDISIAFEAALEAFQKTSRPKNNQYIIFLSDGEPGLNGYSGTRDSVNCPDPQGTASLANPRCALLNNFTNGVGFPTTYTVFLQSQNPNTPPLIRTMTNNIKANGYSSNNERSNAWALTSNYTALLKLMMDEIVTPMLSKSSGSAKNIVIKTPGMKDSTGNISNGDFIFSRRLPIDTSDVMRVDMQLRYDVVVDSTTASGDHITHTVPDSLFEYTFTVRRTENPGSNWEYKQKLSSNCARAPTLDLQYGGASLVGGEVKGSMSTLEIVFDNTYGLFDYNKVTVQVLGVDPSVQDLLSVTLTKGADGKWTGKFPREVSNAANRTDNKLQHALQDSIVLVFRNPDIPLDTIRLAVPFASQKMSFYDKPGDPLKSGGNELPNVIEVRAGEVRDIYAKVFAAGDNNLWVWDEDVTKGGGTIKWTIKGTPEVELIMDDRDVTHVTFGTKTSGGTYTITAEYKNSDGELVATKTITIKVTPGDPVNTAGPNPFVPGISKVMDHLKEFDWQSGKSDIVDTYGKIVEHSASGGGPKMGGADNVSGVLVAATASKPIRPSGKKAVGGEVIEYADAKAVIYDAVGHVVFRSKKEDIILTKDGNTFGFVWNGKNEAGRTVGPGTYLMRMTAKMGKDEKFSYQRMIGVTTTVKKK